jgi:hypothetical protein
MDSGRKEVWRRRLGTADVQQIRLLLRVPPERRVQCDYRCICRCSVRHYPHYI